MTAASLVQVVRTGESELRRVGAKTPEFSANRAEPRPCAVFAFAARNFGASL